MSDFNVDLLKPDDQNATNVFFNSIFSYNITVCPQ